jgi:hypothetical protein
MVMELHNLTLGQGLLCAGVGVMLFHLTIVLSATLVMCLHWLAVRLI